MSLLRRLAVLALLALAAPGVAACGSSGDASSSADASALVKDTFGPGHPVKSGKLDVALNLDLQGLSNLQGPTALHLAGPFVTQGTGKLPNFDLDLDVTTKGRSVTVGAVSTGTQGYLTIEGQAFVLTPELYDSFRKGYEQAARKSGASAAATPTLSSLGIEPMRWLKDPHTVGTEQLAGEETTHVSAQVDVPRFLDDLGTLLGKARGVAGGSGGQGLTEQQRKDIGRSVKSVQFDLWTGKGDHTLRRVRIDLALDVPADARASVGGLQQGRITLSLAFADLNRPQTITAPKDARPLSDLTTALQQLGILGSGSSGSGSAGSSPSGSAGTGTTPGSSGAAAVDPAQQKYLTCLEQAGTDLSKVQQCAALLR